MEKKGNLSAVVIHSLPVVCTFGRHHGERVGLPSSVVAFLFAAVPVPAAISIASVGIKVEIGMVVVGRRQDTAH
jgi:hypothetical protein